MFKQGKLSVRLRTPDLAADQAASGKTLMVRFTIQMPHGAFTNGKDDWWYMFCFWNGLSSGTKFHEVFTKKASGQTILAFYVTEDRAAYLWYPDSECETGYRRGKSVIVDGGGSQADIYCNSLNVRRTKEFAWEGIINSMSPVTFTEEGDGPNAE